jgi:hypothetical protein
MQTQEIARFRRNEDVFYRFNSGSDDQWVQECLVGLRKFLFEKYGPGLERLCATSPGSISQFRNRFVNMINFLVDRSQCVDDRTTLFYSVLSIFGAMEDFFMTQPLTDKEKFHMFRVHVLRPLKDEYVCGSNDGMSEQVFADLVRTKYMEVCGLPIPPSH